MPGYQLSGHELGQEAVAVQMGHPRARAEEYKKCLMQPYYCLMEETEKLNAAR